MSRPNRPWIFACLWATVIFGTSCTFIERSIFINWVDNFLPDGPTRHLWYAFWMGFGIFVVKGYHVTEFAVLCSLLQKGLRRVWPEDSGRVILLAAGAAFLYAALDEWHQTFVPGRGGTWVDVCIDSAGIGLVTMAALVRLRRKLAVAVA